MKASLWRALAVLLVVLALAPIGQQPLVEALKPGWATVAAWADPDFRLTAVDVSRTGAASSVTGHFAIARYMIVGPRVYEPGPGMGGTSVVPLGTVWAVLCVFVVALAAWPMRSRRWLHEWAWRLLMGAATLAALLWVLPPLELLGLLRATVLDDARSTDFSGLHALSQFLAGGGRVMVALVAASVCGVVAGALSSRSPVAASAPNA